MPSKEGGSVKGTLDLSGVRDLADQIQSAIDQAEKHGMEAEREYWRTHTTLREGEYRAEVYRAAARAMGGLEVNLAPTGSRTSAVAEFRAAAIVLFQNRAKAMEQMPRDETPSASLASPPMGSIETRSRLVAIMYLSENATRATRDLVVEAVEIATAALDEIDERDTSEEESQERGREEERKDRRLLMDLAASKEWGTAFRRGADVIRAITIAVGPCDADVQLGPTGSRTSAAETARDAAAQRLEEMAASFGSGKAKRQEAQGVDLEKPGDFRLPQAARKLALLARGLGIAMQPDGEGWPKGVLPQKDRDGLVDHADAVLEALRGDKSDGFAGAAWQPGPPCDRSVCKGETIIHESRDVDGPPGKLGQHINIRYCLDCGKRDHAKEPDLEESKITFPPAGAFRSTPELVALSTPDGDAYWLRQEISMEGFVLRGLEIEDEPIEWLASLCTTGEEGEEIALIPTGAKTEEAAMKATTAIAIAEEMVRRWNSGIKEASATAATLLEAAHMISRLQWGLRLSTDGGEIRSDAESICIRMAKEIETGEPFKHPVEEASRRDGDSWGGRRAHQYGDPCGRGEASP